MSETLLIADKFYIIIFSEVGQFFYLFGGKSVGRSDVGIIFKFEKMFGVKVEEVELIFREAADLFLDKFLCRDRTATDVVHPSTIFKRRIVEDIIARNIQIVFCEKLVTDKLL